VPLHVERSACDAYRRARERYSYLSAGAWREWPAIAATDTQERCTSTLHTFSIIRSECPAGGEDEYGR
jgi:hypothetical protein